MWGNRLGWTISAGIVAAAAVLLWLIATSSPRTAPTAFSLDEGNFARLTIPEPPIPVGNAKPAGASYRAAIDAYLQNRALYEDFAQMGTLSSPKASQLKAIDDLVAGAGTALPDLFESRPQEIVNYQNTKASLEALDLLGRVMIDRLGLLNARAGNREAAAKYAHAGIALGAGLSRERLTVDEYSLGQQLIGKSIALLQTCSPPEEAAKWKAFDETRRQFNEQLAPTLRFLRSLDAKTVGTRTGDVFELAKRSQDRMLRVEAILSLGRVRYFVGTSRSAADQRAALAVVRKIAEADPDPIIRAAASAARDLTAEQYRVQ